MNFKNFEPELVKVINNYYSKGMYKESVKQVWLFFHKYVNEEFGIDEDGIKLVNMLFEKTKGKNPLIMINKFESSSDIDEQSGFSSLMRWFVSSIRNLESHEFDFEITKDEATAILNFLDIYVFGRIKKHEDNSLVTDWLKFTCTEGFNDSEEYIKKITNLMTKHQKIKLLLDILDKISLLKKPNNRKNLIDILYSELPENQKNEVLRKIDRKLVEYNDTELLIFFENFPCKIWRDINEIISETIEHKIYLAISKAKILEQFYKERVPLASNLAYVPYESIHVLKAKNKIEQLLINKIREDKYQGLFVFEYHSDYIRFEILNNNEFLIKEIKKLLLEGLSDIKDIIRPIISELKASQKQKELIEEYDKFVVKDNLYEYSLLD